MFTLSVIRTSAAIAFSSSLLLLAGCGIDQAAPAGNSFVASATIDGKLMGGQQPLSGSTVSVYSVGTTGYGSGTISANLLATTTTGIGGNFQFTQVGSQTGASNPVSDIYGCPASNSLIYLVASGGDPTNSGLSGNAAIKFIDAIGQCSSVATGHYVINELSTVVTLAALQQYVNPINEFIGAPSTTSSSSNMSNAQTGILNAFNMVSQIYNQAGVLNNTYTPAGDTGVITATPEVQKINHIADIIAACVNTTSSGSGACTALLSAAVATPTGQAASTNFATSYNPLPAAQDTLQAALFMLQNPLGAGTQVSTCNGASVSSNMECLYNLPASNPPFNPTLTSQPTDWTIGITYASTASQQILGSPVYTLDSPKYLAVDKSGNIWVVNAPSSESSVLGDSVTQLNPYGGFVQQVLTDNGTGPVIFGPGVPAIDPSGSLWVPNFGSASPTSPTGYGTNVIQYNPSNSTTTSINVGGGPTAVAADGQGNILITETSTAFSSSAGGNGTPGADVRKTAGGFPNNSTATILAGSTVSGTPYTGTQATQIAVDSNYTAWITSGASGGGIFTLQYPYNISAATTLNNITYPIAVSIDHNDNAWFKNYQGVLAEKYSSGASILDTAGPFVGDNTTSVSTAIDGAGNIWVANYTNPSGFVSVYSNTGFLIINNLRHNLIGANHIAVDPSGNVWIANLNTNHATPASAPTGSGPGSAAAGAFITEILGAAVPVVTPIAAGLPATTGGTSYLGTTPQ